MQFCHRMSIILTSDITSRVIYLWQDSSCKNVMIENPYELCSVESLCVREFCSTTDMYFCWRVQQRELPYDLERRETFLMKKRGQMMKKKEEMMTRRSKWKNIWSLLFICCSIIWSLKKFVFFFCRKNFHHPFKDLSKYADVQFTMGFKGMLRIVPFVFIKTLRTPYFIFVLISRTTTTFQRHMGRNTWPRVNFWYEQHTSHVTFSRICMRTFQCRIDIDSTLTCSAHFTPYHLHTFMMWLFWLSAILPYTSCCPSSLLSSCSSSWSSASSFMMWRTSILRTVANGDLDILVEYDPLTGYESSDLHISEFTELYIQESSDENGSLNSHGLEYDDYTIGMTLSSSLFIQEREDTASRRRAYHSVDEELSSSQSSSVEHNRIGRLVSLTRKSQTTKKISVAAQKVSKSGFL